MEVLPPGYGDCILITCPLGSGRSRRDWRMLIDTGPDKCWPRLKKCLAAIPPSDDGTRFIDVFVVSHIDHDHIGGARLLLEDGDLHLKFGDIRFNAPMLKVEAGRVGGVAEGRTLSKLLGASAGRRLPWNMAFGGGHAVRVSILLAADAFPQVLASALESLAAERKKQGLSAPGTSVDGPLKIDVFKLSHHGSRANTTLDLLGAVRADHYVVSTNGAIFGHPNDEALARVIMRGGKGPTLWFNHASGDFGERLKRWTDPDMKEKYGYQVATPVSDLDGITLRIAPASPQREQGRPAPSSTNLPTR